VKNIKTKNVYLFLRLGIYLPIVAILGYPIVKTFATVKIIL